MQISPQQFIVTLSQVRKVNKRWVLKALYGALLLLESGSVSIRLQQSSVLHLFSSTSEQKYALSGLDLILTAYELSILG